MAAMTIAYTRAHTPVSWLIRAAQWWAPWSHAGIVDAENNAVIDSRMLRGVSATPLAEWFRIYSATELVRVDCPDPAAAVAFARGLIGARYDYGALMRFISSKLGRNSPRRVHCAELVEAALAVGGRERFRVPLYRITVQQSYITR